MRSFFTSYPKIWIKVFKYSDDYCHHSALRNHILPKETFKMKYPQFWTILKLAAVLVAFLFGAALLISVTELLYIYFSITYDDVSLKKIFLPFQTKFVRLVNVLTFSLVVVSMNCKLLVHTFLIFISTL